jgi:hypothetical protein
MNLKIKPVRGNLVAIKGDRDLVIGVVERGGKLLSSIRVIYRYDNNPWMVDEDPHPDHELISRGDKVMYQTETIVTLSRSSNGKSGRHSLIGISIEGRIVDIFLWETGSKTHRASYEMQVVDLRSSSHGAEVSEVQRWLITKNGMTWTGQVDSGSIVDATP